MGRIVAKLGFLLVVACFALLSQPNIVQAAQSLRVTVDGHSRAMLYPGSVVTVTARVATGPWACVGLASMIDHGSLPLDLGPVKRIHGLAVAVVTIPGRLLTAEPEGAYLLFIGSCASVAPDRPIVASSIIGIEARP